MSGGGRPRGGKQTKIADRTRSRDPGSTRLPGEDGNCGSNSTDTAANVDLPGKDRNYGLDSQDPAANVMYSGIVPQWLL
jgi:hypothetical protein